MPPPERNFRHECGCDRIIAHGSRFQTGAEARELPTEDVSLHTLRHTALSRMIASGIDDFTVMAISGHRSIRMLQRYTHPTNARKIDALESIPA